MVIIFDVVKERFYITGPLFAMIDALLTVQVLFYLLLIFFQRMIYLDNSVALGFMTCMQTEADNR